MLVYCSPENVREYIQLASRFVSTLDGIILNVSERFNKHIRRNLEYVDGKVEYLSTPLLYDFRNSCPFWLEKKNITDGSVSIVYAYDRIFDGGNAVTLDPSQYRIELEKGRIEVFGYVPKTNGGMRVTYSGGYPEISGNPGVMDCPSDLREACIEQVGYELDRKANLFGGTNESMQDAKGGHKAKPVIGFSGFLPQVTATLERYRKAL